MTELQARRESESRKRRPVVECFCATCERSLYVVREEVLFCPVCSSAVTVVSEDARRVDHEVSKS